MRSFEQFLAILQCPDCKGQLDYAPVTSGPDSGHYGLLKCRCSKYPVLDNVPVLMKGAIGIISHWNDGAIHVGPTSQDLVAALERGETTEALLECLIFPRRFPLQGRLTRAGVWPTSLGRRIGLAQTRTDLRRLLSRPDARAQDAFELFYSRRSGNNPYLAEYFLNRFVMPRYLSAMALVQRIGSSDRPVLDIACGYGHFGHYFTRRRRATPAVGVDFNFYQAWGAKRWVAPDAWFACCDASVPLPFRDDCFSAAVCSDAFMILPKKALLVEQVERVAPMRPAIYARVGNKDVGPPNPQTGGEMRPGEYWDLFGRDLSRYFADDALWKDYLMRRNPMARDPVPLEDLRWEKYPSFVRHPEALSAQGEEEGVWCHGIGKLALNTVVGVAADRGDVLETEFLYRTVWGAYEDADMMCYTDRWGKIDKDELRRALAEPHGAAASELIGRFALIGVPDRYVRDRLEILVGRRAAAASEGAAAVDTARTA